MPLTRKLRELAYGLSAANRHSEADAMLRRALVQDEGARALQDVGIDLIGPAEILLETHGGEAPTPTKLRA